MTTEYLNNKNFEKIILSFQNIKQERDKYELIVGDINTSKREEKPESWVKSQLNFNKVKYTFESVQKELAVAFYTLSENIVKYAKFNLIDQDDAIQEGVMICFEKIDKFDPIKGKAFTYFTTISLNHLRQLYRSAKNYNELKRKYSDIVQVKIADNSGGRVKKPTNYQNDLKN